MKTLEVQVQPGKVPTLVLKGSIVAGVKKIVQQHLPAPAAAEIVFNMSDVTIINSTGIGEWVELLQTIGPKTKIQYSRCPPNVIDTINLVPAFLGTAKVIDFFTDFSCTECSTESRELLTPKDISKVGELLQPKRCKSCNGHLTTVGPEEDIFAFCVHQA